MDEFKYMKHWSFTLAIILILIGSYFASDAEPSRNYTGLTVPDIAYDCTLNYKEPPPWKLSKKRLTRRN